MDEKARFLFLKREAYVINLLITGTYRRFQKPATLRNALAHFMDVLFETILIVIYGVGIKNDKNGVNYILI